MGYLILACQCLLAGVFAVSAASKLPVPAFGRAGAFDDFAWSLRRLRLVPPQRAKAVAAVVVAAEAAAAVLLCLPSAAGPVAAAALLSVLSAGIAVSLARGDRVPCRCFGASEAPLGAAHLIRNGLLLAAAVTATAGRLAGPVHLGHPAGVTVALAGAALGLVLVLLFDDLTSLFARS
ncbi:MauE/DoxX family redox-associated membrane protein [Actinomadura macrotermitis]|uniref:Methylamine utilisation protein MauE domain-containing protein n=1 Tax=Actinomadura macrotermitis TaxID=2585200 RepID=A0A7K0C6H4_9ACTN|nr:MauE/DoxX family redox-associated membrane protein [Actinomadura macrotermitis]MQY08404.1 hypothetical protein [Actinomadura macrotermitis]